MKKKITALDLSYNLFCRLERRMKAEGYPGLLALYALAQLADASGNPLILKKAQILLGRYPDQIDHPYYNFESYRVGGNGKAYLVMKGLADREKDLLGKYAQITLEAPVDAAGIQCMPYAAGKENAPVWIDVVTATTPFMVMAGIALGKRDYIQYGADQCFKMYDLFEDTENHLLHQAKGFMPDPAAISHDHWSRGNGWGLVGLADMVQYLPKDDPLWAESAKRLKRHCAALLPFQTERGLWRQSIACELAWEESSGTALIAYGLGAGIRYGALETEIYFPAFEKAVNGLADFCVNGDFSTEYCCEGCLCPGDGAEKGSLKAYLSIPHPRKDEPHSFGPIMLAMIEAHKNGLTLIDWQKEG